MAKRHPTSEISMNNSEIYPTRTDILWRGSCVLRAVQGIGPSHWFATGVSIDTRTLKPGDLFIALQGPNFDGHDFIDTALALGAAAVLVQDHSQKHFDPEKMQGSPKMDDTMVIKQKNLEQAKRRENWENLEKEKETLARCPSTQQTPIKTSERPIFSKDNSIGKEVHKAIINWAERYAGQALVVVPDTFQALQHLARAARQRFQGRVLALTGSVGKTTLKDGLAHILSQQGTVSASLGSLNNHLGVPLSLARLPQNAHYAIFEVGMNHAGEIANLMPWIEPHVALISNVSYQHGQFFENLEAIVRAKGEIFSYAPLALNMSYFCPESSVKALKSTDEKYFTGILPQDSPHYGALHQQGQHINRWITFGQNTESNVRLIAKKPENTGMRIDILIDHQPFSYHWPLQAEHTITNSLALVAGAYAMGADMKKVMHALETIQPSPGRGNIRTIGGVSIIDESYNAAPASMQAALKDFSQKFAQRNRVSMGNVEKSQSNVVKSDSTNHQSEKKVEHASTISTTNKIGKCYIVLGEMRELGNQSHACHAALLPLLEACSADGIWVCGPAFQPFLHQIPLLQGYSDTIFGLLPSILDALQPGDTVLIKGANSMRTFALMDALQHR